MGFLEERASSWALNLACLLEETGWLGRGIAGTMWPEPRSVVKGLHAQQRSGRF